MITGTNSSRWRHVTSATRVITISPGTVTGHASAGGAFRRMWTSSTAKFLASSMW
jgi:hypothetical protein